MQPGGSGLSHCGRRARTRFWCSQALGSRTGAENSGYVSRRLCADVARRIEPPSGHYWMGWMREQTGNYAWARGCFVCRAPCRSNHDRLAVDAQTVSRVNVFFVILALVPQKVSWSTEDDHDRHGCKLPPCCPPGSAIGPSDLSYSRSHIHPLESVHA